MIFAKHVIVAANYIFAFSMPFSHIGGYLGAGLSFLMIWSTWGKHRKEPLKLFLKIFIIYGLIRALFSAEPQVGYEAMFGYFTQWFLPFLLGLAAADAQISKKAFWAFFYTFFALVVLSVLAYFGLFYKHFGADIYLVNEGLLKGLRSHIAMGALCLLFSFLSISMSMFNQELSKRLKLIFALGGFLSLLALLLTGSRGYYLAAALVYSIFGIYWFIKTRKIRMVLISIPLLIAVVISLYLLVPGFRARIERTGVQDPNVNGRLSLYKVALWEIKSSPIFGYGPGEGIKQSKFFDRLPEQDQNVRKHTHLHSFYLNFMADFGLAGFVIFGFILFVWLKSLWSAYSHSADVFTKALAFGVFWGVIGILIGDAFDTLLRGPGVAMEVFWLTGLVFGLRTGEKEKK